MKLIQLMAELIKQECASDSEEEYDQRNDSIQRQGIWSDDQLLKFMVFTYFNKQIMSSKLQRRTLKIFKQMARFIQSRSSIQCRSQNQKMIKKYKSINKILKVFIDKCGRQQFNKHCLSFSKHSQVKYIINEQPPKQKAGHAISKSTQTQFSDDSQDASDHSSPKVEKQALIQPMQEGVPNYYQGI